MANNIAQVKRSLLDAIAKTVEPGKTVTPNSAQLAETLSHAYKNLADAGRG